MKRREDPEELDVSPLRRNGGPWWVRAFAWVGLPAFLILYLLGAVPGLQSPLLAQQGIMTKHEDTTKELLRTMRLVCRGVWQSQPEVQRQCGDE